jgi:hypothetical protein
MGRGPSVRGSDDRGLTRDQRREWPQKAQKEEKKVRPKTGGTQLTSRSSLLFGFLFVFFVAIPLLCI